ncbi:unnamed protein product [Ranitomeya imitator]|uniref:Uncharacterized protein n=1 Tax=Ranitomeya imitator TaxID=111125 RepID=A0ABN9KU24_9NEOB|nr:unnamed protein product [Ranitomeya imitator]
MCPSCGNYDCWRSLGTRKFLVRAKTVTSICAPSPEENLPSLRTSMCLFNSGKTEGNDVQSISPHRSPWSRGSESRQRPSRKESRQRGHLWISWQLANNILSKHAATQLSAHSQPWLSERLKKLDVTITIHAERLMFDVLNAAAVEKLSDTFYVELH